MQTSSISLAAAIAAALTVAAPAPASAGGWIVSGRPGFVPPMRSVAPFFHPAPGGFARFGHGEFFRHGPNGPFSPFGAERFARFGNPQFEPVGRSAFGPFGPGAQIIPLGIGGGGYAPPASPYVAGEIPAGPYVLAPINVSVVAPSNGCPDGDGHFARAGGPRIITFERPRTDSGAKMPVIIYGTGGRGGC